MSVPDVPAPSGRLLKPAGLQIALAASLWLAADAGGFAVDWSDVPAWAAAASLEQAAGAVGLATAQVLSSWLALVTLADLAAGRPGRQRRVRTRHRPSLRLDHRLVAIALTVGSFTGPHGPAAAAVPVGLHQANGRDGRSVLPPHLQVPTVAPAGGSGPDDTAGEGTARVQPGDSLWSLAAARLRRLRGPDVGQHEIARYWVRVVDANRPELRSGDPDLIYPGEVVVLPAV